MTAKILAVCGLIALAYILRAVAWRDTKQTPGREPDMEAGTPPPNSGQTDELQQRLDALASSISDATTRVNGDLGLLRDEIAKLNEQHADVDLSPVIERVDNLIVQVNNIDVTQVTESGEGDVTVEDGGAGDQPAEGPPEPGVKPVEGEQ